MRRSSWHPKSRVAQGLMVLAALFPSSRAIAQAPAPAAVPIVATAPADLPKFAVVSIRQNNSGTSEFRVMNTPDGVSAKNVSLLMLVRGCYGMFTSLDDKFLGVPAWGKTERFDIEAKVDPADADAFSKLTQQQRNIEIQMLLAERFKLRVHTETKQQPIYAMVLAKGGPKLTVAKPGDTYANGITDRQGHTGAGVVLSTRRSVQAQAAPMSVLSVILTQVVGRTVEDRTGLAGLYDISLKWSPESAAPAEGSESSAETGPSIFTALQEQLGLKLDAVKAPAEYLVIDRVEQPSAN